MEMTRRQYQQPSTIIEDAWMAYKKVVGADSLSFIDFKAGFNAAMKIMAAKPEN